MAKSTAIATAPAAPKPARRRMGESAAAAFERGRAMGRKSYARYQTLDKNLRATSEGMGLAFLTAALAGWYVKSEGGVLANIHESIPLNVLDVATLGAIGATLYYAKKNPTMAMRFYGPASSLVGIATFGYFST